MNWILEKVFGKTSEPECVVPKQSVIPIADEYAQSVSVKEMREDRPKFAREYSRVLKGGIRCQIRYRSSYGLGRYSSGELTQANGRWVSFDPGRVADKILDPTLLLHVEEFSAYARKADAEFMSSNPSRYVDESGQAWEKVR